MTGSTVYSYGMAITSRIEPIRPNARQYCLSSLFYSWIVTPMHFLSLLPLRPPQPDAYDEIKAAQIAAFFTLKEGGVSDVLKLAKLLYLAERESFARYATPLTGDRLSSMKDGPVLSETLNYLRGEGRPPKAWSDLFRKREGNSLSLRAGVSEDNLLRLSDSDVELLNDVWRKFGPMSPHDVWVYVHTSSKVPEYENPGRSSRPIKINALLKAVGYSTAETEEILERLEEQNQFQAALKKAAV
jgi:uncharacterized phage-associated protein